MIRMDVFQTIVLFGGMVFSLVFIAIDLGGVTEPIAIASAADKLRVLSTSMSFTELATWSVLIGGFLLGVAWLSAWTNLDPLITATILVGFEAWLTRGLHLDGLADFFDGLGGGNGPEKRLAIMKDSATGAFGVVGLICILLLKVSCLSALLVDFPENAILLAASPAAARLAMAGLAFKSAYPRERGTGHAFVGRAKGGDLLLGTVLMLPVLIAGWPGIIVVLAAQLPALWLRRKAHQAFGGVTGDVLGASCEMGEAAGWLAALVFLGMG